MSVRVGINGFGRIGRNFLRSVLELEKGPGDEPRRRDRRHQRPRIARGEQPPSPLRLDLRPARNQCDQDRQGHPVGDREITVFEERDPKAIGWGGLKVDVVDRVHRALHEQGAADGHIEAGAKRVIISAPGKEADATFVIGVNDETFDPDRHFVVSAASCTTNCLVPMVKVLDDAFGIRQGLMTTVHAYTNDQELLDLGRDNLRRARAAAVNVIPSTTGAARSTSLVLQAMKGRLDGARSVSRSSTDRSPTSTAVVGAEVNADGERGFPGGIWDGPSRRHSRLQQEQIVSSDIVGGPPRAPSTPP